MPVAFHPPLAHPVDLPQPARAADDAPNGDLFAALLAGAGKLAVASAAGKAPAIADSDGKAQAAAVANGDRSQDAGDPALFDPSNLFAAWPGAQPAAEAARATGDAASLPDPADAVVSRVSRGVGDAVDAMPASAPAITARGASADAVETADKGTPRARTAPARRSTTLHAQDGTHARPTPGDTSASTPRGVQAPTAAPTASFAAAAALLARAPGTDASGDAGISTIDRHDGADAAPGVNLGAAAASASISLARPIAEPVGSPGFATQVAGEIAQLVHINADRAQLHVHPADMGPIDVTMSVRHDQVSVTMVAADPQTRAALELALPQLRDLLANQGLALANASVNDHAPRDDGRRDTTGGPGARPATVAGIDAVPAAHPVSSVALRRLVDLYA